MEKWKTIKGLEKTHEISNCGRIRSLDRYVNSKNDSKRKVKGQIIKPHKDKDGYLEVSIRTGGKRKVFKMHRLVAIAFIENP